MRNIQLRAGVYCSLLLCCAMVFSSWSYADTIKVRADMWPPYNAEPDSPRPGYVVEILKVIFEPQGHSIDYQTESWAKAISDMMEGSADMIIGASTDAPGALFPVKSMGVIHNSFFVKKGTAWRYAGVDSLKNIKLGVITSYAYDDGGPIDKYIKISYAPAVQLMLGDGALERNIRKLQDGRLDAVIEDESVIAFTLKKMGIASDEFINAGLADVPKDLFVAFTPNNATTRKYAGMWDEGIEKLRQSGDLKKILDRYSVNDWK